MKTTTTNTATPTTRFDIETWDPENVSISHETRGLRIDKEVQFLSLDMVGPNSEFRFSESCH